MCPTGTEYKEGQECQKWRKVDQIGKKVNKYTMWLKEAGGVVVPIRYYSTYVAFHWRRAGAGLKSQLILVDIH